MNILRLAAGLAPAGLVLLQLVPVLEGRRGMQEK